ncbi:MAG: shikimate kinase [Oscillospiraceae bacterium]|nr:shikimate kinase [Oscillospiraceae bacterium]
MKNIVLIGMPAAGKSTVGVLIAKTLGFAFVDTDLIIQQNTGRLLQDIIDNDGLDAFCIDEERAVCSVSSERNAVIATGGSAVYSRDAMLFLKKHGLVYYLSLPVEELSKRLSNIKTRGIAKRPEDSVEDVFRRRAELYAEYSDITIDCLGKTAEEIVSEICDYHKLAGVE